jgi:hypothetical protein
VFRTWYFFWGGGGGTDPDPRILKKSEMIKKIEGG